jgi:hypothetical protein
MYHIEQILLNLTRAISSVSYLGVFGDNNLYSKDSQLNNKEPESKILSSYYVNLVLDHLINNELVIKKRGYMFKEDDPEFSSFPTINGMNKYYPNSELIDELSPYLFLVTSNFNINKTELAFVKQKHFDESGKVISTTKKYPRSEQIRSDRDNLQIINKYLSEQNFALKAPLKRIYSDNQNRGGRIYTAIQNIPNNRLPIRNSLRLNGKPLIELDFKANHLSICIALYESDTFKEIPSDPYTLLLSQAGFINKEATLYREYAKSFVTRALGAQDLRGAQNAFRAWQKKHEDEHPSLSFKTMTNGELFKKLRKAFEELFPNTTLFSDLGAHLQKLEGDIMMTVLLESVEKDVPIIPLHDACLCPEHNSSLVELLMIKAWSTNLRTQIQPTVSMKS